MKRPMKEHKRALNTSRSMVTIETPTGCTEFDSYSCRDEQSISSVAVRMRKRKPFLTHYDIPYLMVLHGKTQQNHKTTLKLYTEDTLKKN